MKTEYFRKEKLKEMHEYEKKQKENRKKVFEEGVKRYKSLRNQIPLYKKIEESYIIKSILLEKQRIQRSLSQRKECFRSMSFEELGSHENKYLSHLTHNQNLRKRRQKNYFIGNSIQQNHLNFFQAKIGRILSEENLKKQEEDKKKMENRLLLIRKRKNYGNLVQELYSSFSSPKKSESLVKTPKKLKIKPKVHVAYTKPVIKVKKYTQSPKSIEKTILESKSADYLFKKKEKKIPLIKLPKIKLKKPEYNKNRISLIENIAKKLDKQTQKLDFISNTSNLSVIECDIVSKAYIHSIQTKLALLDNLYKQ